MLAKVLCHAMLAREVPVHFALIDSLVARVALLASSSVSSLVPRSAIQASLHVRWQLASSLYYAAVRAWLETVSVLVARRKRYR